MSIPKFKRKPSGLDYVDNAFEIQKDIMNLASKLSAKAIEYTNNFNQI